MSSLVSQKLTTDFPKTGRCIRCERPLHTSEYKGIALAYYNSQGYGCVNCFQRKHKGKVTPDRIEKIEEFLGNRFQNGDFLNAW